MEESAEECALRELKEETGVSGCIIKQFHTFTSPERDPRERVITIAYYALMKWQKAEGADDAEFADWIEIDNLPPLAFDHSEIIRMALEAIRRDIFFEPVGFELLNDIFSMSELQKVYEKILGKEFDRRNFAKKIKHLGILEEVKDEEPIQTLIHEDKILPLPFLNLNLPPEAEGNVTAFVSDASGSIDHDNWPDWLINTEVDSHADKAPQKSRKSTFFRLNRKKYNKLKDDDSFEF